MSERRPGFYREDDLPAPVPIWHEFMAGFEWMALRWSPVYYGVGVPRGDGSPVVLVPGFLGTDSYLLELYGWLGRIGYRPYLSQIGRNAECLDIMGARLLQTIEQAYAGALRKVHVIGHSLGGALARSVAARRPDRIASVIALAAPFRGLRSAHPMALSAADRVRTRIVREQSHQVRPGCYTGSCMCDTVSVLRARLSAAIPQTAVYTKADGIVDWRVCVNDDPGTDVEVLGTHTGMAVNPMVYQVIGDRLAGVGLASWPEPNEATRSRGDLETP
jgi:pimeloyl-ACP methyl ester carboxylesterase